MASRDKNAKQLPIVNDPDAIQAQISPSELEEEIDSSPTSGINHQASAAPSQLNIRTSVRQAARRTSETNIDIDFLHEGHPKQSAGPASSQSSVSGSRPSAKLTTKSASAAKSALARTAMPSKRAKITSFLQASPRTLDPGFRLGLTVGTINAIKIATQLAPHITAAVSASDYDSRVRDAMAAMQLQLEQQRIQTELEKDKSDSLQALLQSIQQQKLMQDHHSLELQDAQQARYLLAEAAILEEKAKTTALQADNSRMNQQLVELNSRSQPFMVPSASRSAQRFDQGQASLRHPLSLSSVPHSATKFTQQLAQSIRGLPTHLSSSTRPLPSLSEAQHQSLQTYTARHPEPMETIRQNSVYRAQLTATDTGIRSLLSRKDSKACERCGGIHEYVDDLCTAIISTKGHKCVPLSQEEEDHRITIKITHHFDPTPLQSPREIEPRSSHSFNLLPKQRVNRMQLGLNERSHTYVLRG